MRYDHTQYGQTYLLLVGVGAATLVGAWLTPIPAVRVVLLLSGSLVLLLAASFRHLTVQDEGDRLVIEFGPLPLFRRSIPYSDIVRAERGRTTVIDGWGVHVSPRGGWTWNLWGFDCVVLDLTRGRRLAIGTDDPEGLTTFLADRVRHEMRADR